MHDGIVYNMSTPEEVKQILNHSLAAIGHLECCPKEPQIQDVLSTLRKEVRYWREQREVLLLNVARMESSLQYQWSWWVYSTDRRKGCIPGLTFSCPIWYDYQIDAVTDACKAPLLKHSRDVFYVCQLRTRSREQDIAGPLAFYDCMAPWTEDGELPTVGTQLHPFSRGDCANITDALYAAHEEFEDSVEWDGSSGIKFILLETGGF